MRPGRLGNVWGAMDVQTHGVSQAVPYAPQSLAHILGPVSQLDDVILQLLDARPVCRRRWRWSWRRWGWSWWWSRGRCWCRRGWGRWSRGEECLESGLDDFADAAGMLGGVVVELGHESVREGDGDSGHGWGPLSVVWNLWRPARTSQTLGSGRRRLQVSSAGRDPLV